MSDRQELLRAKGRISQKLANAEASLQAMKNHNVKADAPNMHRLELTINSLQDLLTSIDAELKKGKITSAVGNIANKIRGIDPSWKRHAKETGYMNALGQLESFVGFMDSLKNGKNDSLIESVKSALSESSAHRPYSEFSPVEDEADISDEDFQNYIDEQGGEDSDISEGSDEIDALLRSFADGTISEDELSDKLHSLVGLTGGMGDAVGDVSETENTMGGSQTGNALDEELEKLKEYLKG